MRKSRVVLIGVAVAAAAATGSAFTAGNSFGTTENIAGYGESTVTGATVSNIHYTVDSSDSSKLASVVFTVAEDLTGGTAHVVMKDDATTPVVLDDSGCTIATSTITCTLSPTVPFAHLATTALSVVK